MASTYVNDLRLNEMATGDQSGSWGTVTNTNLELIAEAFGFGTEAITTNADTHTSTIADGATDPIRALFIKYTGTLDSTCTITIGPNTVNKFCFIHNATSGSQSIIISQGSGANVTIATGQTKAVYLDGAGSGAAVIDAFSTLSVVDLQVDDDLTLKSDSAVLGFGADTDTTLTHTDGTGLTLNSTNKLCFNDASQFIQGASATVLDIAATDEIELTATLVDVVGNFTNSGTIVSAGKITADAGIDIDNFNIDGTTIALSSGNMTLDVAGEINIDAGGGNITILDDGTGIAYLANSSGDFVIQSATSDKDLLFKGNDGGSTITALQLDMSENGGASFSDNVNLLDGKKLQIGNSADLKLTHDGTNGDFESAGNLTFDVAGNINLDAGGANINLYDDGTHFADLQNENSDFRIISIISDKDIIFRGNDGGSYIDALTLDMSAAGAATFNNDVTAFSDERLKSDIATIPDALSKVSEMRGVHYVRNETGQASSGVIAQELQKIAPELVRTAEDEMGTLSVNYGNITGYLIEAIKELKAEIEELKAR